MDRARAVALTVVAATLWGTSFPANDLGLQATDPFTFMAVRFGIAFVVSAAVALALGALDASWVRNKWVWGLGLVNALGYQLQFVGQELTTPGAAALMVNAGNLAVPLFAWLLHGERLQGAKAPALALAAAGVFLVGTKGDLGELASSAVVGNLLTLLAGLCWAAVIVLNKAAVEGKGLLGLTTTVVGLTALFALPGALLLGSYAMAPQALLAAGYTGVFCTAVAFLLWSAGLRYITSVVSGLVLLWEVVVALLLSIALGLEALTLAGLAGAALILAAIALASAGPAGEARTSARGEPGAAPAAPLPEPAGSEAPGAPPR